MSDNKTIQDALAEVQRKVNEERAARVAEMISEVQRGERYNPKTGKYEAPIRKLKPDTSVGKQTLTAEPTTTTTTPKTTTPSTPKTGVPVTGKLMPGASTTEKTLGTIGKIVGATSMAGTGALGAAGVGGMASGAIGALATGTETGREIGRKIGQTEIGKTVADVARKAGEAIGIREPSQSKPAETPKPTELPKIDVPAKQTTPAPSQTKKPEPSSFGAAFKAAREKATEMGKPSTGQFEYKGKEYQTNIKGEKYVPMPQQTKVGTGTTTAPKPETSTTTSAAATPAPKTPDTSTSKPSETPLKDFVKNAMTGNYETPIMDRIKGKTPEESESGGKKKKMSEETNPMIAAFLKLQESNPQNMFEAAKKAKKDYDGDGKIESPKDEVWGSRFAAAKKAGKMEENYVIPDDEPEPEDVGDKKWAYPKKGRKADRIVDISSKEHGPHARVHLFHNMGPKGKHTVAHTVGSTQTTDVYAYHNHKPSDDMIKRHWSADINEGNIDPVVTGSSSVTKSKTGYVDPSTPTEPYKKAPVSTAAGDVLDKAKNALDKTGVKEESAMREAKLNEISKELAGRYLKKVPYNYGNARYASDEGWGKTAEWGERTMKNREKGVSHAVDKLTGKAKVNIKEEEAEQEVTFSQAEIDHLNSFFLEASVAPNRPEVATGADSVSDKMSQNDVTGTSTESGGKKKVKEEVELEEGDLTIRTLYNKWAGHASGYHEKSGAKANAVEKAITKVHGPKVMSHLKKALNANLQGNFDRENSHFEKARTAAGKSEMIGATVGSGRSEFRKTNEETLQEGRPKKNPTPETTERDPRKHIQVEAGRAAAGNVIDFHHNDGTKSKITPAMGRRITSHLNSLKPADRQAAVNKMHDSAEGLKV